MVDHSEMKALAAGRNRTYAVLSALYSAPPSKELAGMIRDGALSRVNGSASLGAAADDLISFFRETSVDDLETELTAEHTRLFVLPSGVVPHESFYLDERQRLGGRTTVQVCRYYENAGAQLTKACLDLPDHMGVELEFMNFLCDLEEQFWEASDLSGVEKSLGFQNGFLTEHLLSWHKPLCDRIQEEARLDVYRALARLTVDFLEAERTFVPELAAKIKPD